MKRFLDFLKEQKEIITEYSYQKDDPGYAWYFFGYYKYNVKNKQHYGSKVIAILPSSQVKKPHMSEFEVIYSKIPQQFEEGQKYEIDDFIEVFGEEDVFNEIFQKIRYRKPKEASTDNDGNGEKITIKGSNKSGKDYENTVNNGLDDFMTNELPKIPQLKNQKFYSVASGNDSRKADIMAVHDRKEFNSDKKRTTEMDDKFFIEVKVDKMGSFLNPTFTWDINNGFKRTQKFAKAVSDDKLETNMEQVSDEKNIFEQSEKYLEDLLNEQSGEMIKKYHTAIETLFNRWNTLITQRGIDENIMDEKDIVLPYSLQDAAIVLQKAQKYVEDADITEQDSILTIQSIEQFIRKFNTIKLLNRHHGYERGEGSMNILNNYMVTAGEDGALQYVKNLIVQWYSLVGTGKDCAYIQIGPRKKDGEDVGNLYLIRPDYNPLDLDIPLFESVYNVCRIDVFFAILKGKISLQGRFRFPSTTNSTSEISLDKKDTEKYINVSDIDINDKFFSKNKIS